MSSQLWRGVYHLLAVFAFRSVTFTSRPEECGERIRYASWSAPALCRLLVR